jgi:hypothetical protein
MCSLLAKKYVAICTCTYVYIHACHEPLNRLPSRGIVSLVYVGGCLQSDTHGYSDFHTKYVAVHDHTRLDVFPRSTKCALACTTLFVSRGIDVSSPSRLNEHFNTLGRVGVEIRLTPTLTLKSPGQSAQ